MNPILIPDVGYKPFERKLIKLAFEHVLKCHKKNKSRIVSFLCERNKILSIGINHEKRTHTLARNYIHNKIHSECNSIFRVRHLGIHYARCTIYNVRIDRNNQIRNSKPCSRCVDFLGLLGIKRISFTNEFGEFEVL